MLTSRDMTGRFFKIFAATLLSFTLSYYGVAWAVLQCLHEDDLSQGAITDVENHTNYHEAALDHESPSLKCPGPACVIESMADSSSQSRSLNLTGEVRLNFADSLAMRSTAGDEKSVHWRRSVFDRSPNAVSRYLSFSILRI